jgi:redox-sensitive bicupin YhaK (pirin superfamily)
MIVIRKSAERGHADHGWLESRHTFSFADYHDPRHMGFRALRVINEDRVQPGRGFGTHGHRDMEIVSYVLAGELEHKDSLGTGSIVRPGEVQYMSAGSGVRHSEFNPSATEPLHFLQIWIQPSEQGLAPRYAQQRIDAKQQENGLALVVSPDGRAGSIAVRQDVALFAARWKIGQGARHALASGRHAWVQIARGELDVAGQRLSAGDGAAITQERELQLEARTACEFLLFDLS